MSNYCYGMDALSLKQANELWVCVDLFSAYPDRAEHSDPFQFLEVDRGGLSFRYPSIDQKGNLAVWLDKYKINQFA